MTTTDAAEALGWVRSVCAGRLEPNPVSGRGPTGHGKRPVEGPVVLSAPGRGGSGVEGDAIGDARHHGGADQAVYAFSREELDRWERELGTDLPDGSFGENLTVAGWDADASVLGERWEVGEARLVVTAARIPCATFAGAMGRRGWVREFTRRGRSGVYLAVERPGRVRAGDAVRLLHRPEHGVTVMDLFRARTTERGMLPELLAAGEDLLPRFRAEAQELL